VLVWFLLGITLFAFPVICRKICTLHRYRCVSEGAYLHWTESQLWLHGCNVIDTHRHVPVLSRDACVCCVHAAVALASARNRTEIRIE